VAPTTTKSSRRRQHFCRDTRLGGQTGIVADVAAVCIVGSVPGSSFPPRSRTVARNCGKRLSHVRSRRFSTGRTPLANSCLSLLDAAADTATSERGQHLGSHRGGRVEATVGWSLNRSPDNGPCAPPTRHEPDIAGFKRTETQGSTHDARSPTGGHAQSGAAVSRVTTLSKRHQSAASASTKPLWASTRASSHPDLR
jgi:hypothetical protein